MTAKASIAPAVDVNELARDLAKTVTGVERLIAAEAQKRALKFGERYAKAAEERIQANAADMRQLQDLVAELRRQMKPLERYAAGYFALKNRTQEIIATSRQRNEPVPVEVLQQAITNAQEAEVAERDRQRSATQTKET